MDRPSGSDDLLRQNVFSSIHMSTPIKTHQVTVSYPACSLCCGGGAQSSSGSSLLSGTASKKAGRKQAVFQVTLYANSSESFIVWGKKVDEPKGIIWLRSCSVRRGSDNEGNMPIELLTKGCRGRCSHTLRFSSRIVAEDWYRSLKQESRKNTPMEHDDPFSSDSGEEEDSPLDRILSDTAMDACNNEPHFLYQVPSSRRSSSPAMKLVHTHNTTGDYLSSSLPQYSKPSGNHGGSFRLPFTSSNRKISLPVQKTTQQHQQRSVNLLDLGSNAADLERWSWPVEVSN